jgi:hypothetical protein
MVLMPCRKEIPACDEYVIINGRPMNKAEYEAWCKCEAAKEAEIHEKPIPGLGEQRCR